MVIFSDIFQFIDIKDPIKTKKALVTFFQTQSINNWTHLDKGNFFVTLAKYAHLSSEISESLSYFESVKKFLDQVPPSTPNSYLGDYYYHYSILKMDLGNLSDAKQLGLLCFEFYKRQDKKDGIGKAYDLLSQIELKHLNFDEAIEYAQKSIDILEEINGSVDVSYNNLGEIYRIQGDFKNALHMYQLSFAIAQKNEDLYTMAIIHNNFGLIYSELDEFALALENFEQSYEYFSELGIFDFECTLDYAETLISAYSLLDARRFEYIGIIETLLIELQQHIHLTESNIYLFSFITLLGQFETKRNNFYTAEQYFTAALDIADFTNNPFLKIVIRVHLINWALKQYNVDKSKYYLEKSKGFLNEAKLLTFQTLKATLLAELQVLEAIILSFTDEFQTNFILSETMNFALKINNLRLISKISTEFAKIKEKNADQKNYIEILQYVTSIARLTNMQQRE